MFSNYSGVKLEISNTKKFEDFTKYMEIKQHATK